MAEHKLPTNLPIARNIYSGYYLHRYRAVNSPDKFSKLVRQETYSNGVTSFSVAVLTHGDYGCAPYLGEHRMNSRVIEAWSNVMLGKRNPKHFADVVKQQCGISLHVDEVYNKYRLLFVRFGETYSVSDYDGLEGLEDGKEYSAF
jgi:hypothetical protein